MKSLSCFWLFATPWTVAYQAPPFIGFSKQEYWSGLPFPSPGDLPDPGIEPGSPAFQADALTSEPRGTWIKKSSLSKKTTVMKYTRTHVCLYVYAHTHTYTHTHTTRLNCKGLEKTWKPKWALRRPTFDLGHLPPILVILNFYSFTRREEQMSKLTPTQGNLLPISWATSSMSE